MEPKSHSEFCHVPLRIIIAGHFAWQTWAFCCGARVYGRSAGVGLTPPTKQWYESEKVLAAEDPTCYEAEGFEVRRWDTGDVITRTPFPAEKKMIPVLHSDLKSALVSRAREMDNVEIKFGSRVADVETGGPEVTLATGERISGDLIIIADGVGSSLKWKVCPSKLERAQSTGEAAYRLVLSRQLLEKDEELLALVQRPWATRWDGPRGKIMAYPIHNFELLNMVLLHPAENAEESWNSTIQKHHVLADFQAWNSVVRKLIDLAPDNVPNFRVLTHSPSPAWVNGSVMLLGDACHAMPPYLGQGVAQAVEDAIAITTVLSLIESKQQLPAALLAYETSRKTRVIEMQAATQQVAYRKDGELKVAREKGEEDALDAKNSNDLIKVMRSSWEYDAAEAAQMALLSGLAKA
ncbi:FAD-dependent monooxygenase [Hyphodiscus hymeniophilus]|uniref:FAD-dependent monooxygenase n=1 Tax=Hyphodiscus hymeniophilus TaxID=353542 RepID=A0A9P6SK67_9HELO|nr:FAD-dependent monooxygenase [Hyphodiscus hymeniophilus]